MCEPRHLAPKGVSGAARPMSEPDPQARSTAARIIGGVLLVLLALPALAVTVCGGIFTYGAFADGQFYGTLGIAYAALIGGATCLAVIVYLFIKLL